MENKKTQKLSIAALIISILPLATFIPALFNISLPDGVRSAWAGINILSVIVGLILSILCVKNRNSRSIINIVPLCCSSILLHKEETMRSIKTICIVKLLILS